MYIAIVTNFAFYGLHRERVLKISGDKTLTLEKIRR